MLGEWKCKIQPPDGHYQEGTVSLLTSEQGFVRDMRLPRHIVPSAYNLSLTPFIIPDNYTIQGTIDILATTQQADNKCDSKVRGRTKGQYEITKFTANLKGTVSRDF